MHLGTTFQLFFDGRPRWVFEEYFYNIHYPLRRVDYWRQILEAVVLCGLNIEDSV